MVEPVSKSVSGITHNVHVRTEDGDMEEYNGVLDVMKLPNGNLKFTHNGILKEKTNGEVIRSRVKNVNNAHKYICPDCESDEGALITMVDYGPILEITCSKCGSMNGFERRDL